ncbi:MAG: efflux RND transporter periplasmic adaptor subunit [Sphingobacteriaceae bacterium]
MKKRYIIYALLIIALGSFVAYRIVENKKKAAPPAGGVARAPAMAMKAEGVVVKPQRFSSSIAVSGSIEANEQVTIRSEVSGVVRSLNFEEGSFVKKGQVLLSIDDSEIRAQLAQALTRQDLASQTEKRANLLLEKEAISQEEYDTALADRRALESQTQLIRAQLAKTRVLAPFSGKIGLRSISAGEYVTPTIIVANLVSTNPVKILFAVPEKYAGKLQISSGITFTVSGSNKEYTAKIYAIEPGIDVATRTLQLKAKAANLSGQLLPGSFTNVTIPLVTINDALLIPTQAVIPILNGKQVFISKNGKAAATAIETSVRTEADVLVTSGLKAGDTVLTTGVMTLKDQMPVTITVGNKK